MKLLRNTNTPALTSKLSWIVVVLLLAAIGITINDNLQQKSLRSSADNGVLIPSTAPSSPDLSRIEITKHVSESTQISPQSGFGDEFLEFLKKFVGSIR